MAIGVDCTLEVFRWSGRTFARAFEQAAPDGSCFDNIGFRDGGFWAETKGTGPAEEERRNPRRAADRARGGTGRGSASGEGHGERPARQRLQCMSANSVWIAKPSKTSVPIMVMSPDGQELFLRTGNGWVRADRHNRKPPLTVVSRLPLDRPTVWAAVSELAWLQTGGIRAGMAAGSSAPSTANSGLPVGAGVHAAIRPGG